jgi:hypothetical protein
MMVERPQGRKIGGSFPGLRSAPHRHGQASRVAEFAAFQTKGLVARMERRGAPRSPGKAAPDFPPVPLRLPGIPCGLRIVRPSASGVAKFASLEAEGLDGGERLHPPVSQPKFGELPNVG